MWLAAIHDMHAVGGVERPQARLRFGNHATLDNALRDESAYSAIGQHREQFALSVEDTWHIADVEQLRGMQPTRQVGGGIVGVDIERLALWAERERRDD